MFGYFDWIFYLLPKAVVFPILIFVGLDHATPTRHYPAVALACVPALAYLALLALNQVLPLAGPFAGLSEPTRRWVQTVTTLSGGFIMLSLLWGSTLALLIDGRVRPAVGCLLLAAAFSLFGVIHSPLPSGPIVLPGEAIRMMKEQGRYEVSRLQTPYHWAAAYATSAALLLALARWGSPPGKLDEAGELAT